MTRCIEAAECHLVILLGHSPQSSPTSGASASSAGSTLVSSSSAAQSGQTMISPSTTSAARVIVASHSGQFAVMVCSFLISDSGALWAFAGCKLRLVDHGCDHALGNILS